MKPAYVILLLLVGLFTGTSAFAANDPFDDQLNQLRGVLAGFKGTTVRAVGNVVIVEGELDDPADVERLNAVVTAMQPISHLETKMSVQSVVSVSKAGRDRVTDEIRRDIAIPTVRLRWVRDVLILEGSVATDYDADRAVELAKIGLGVGQENGAWRKTRLVDMMLVRSRGGRRPTPTDRTKSATPVLRNGKKS